MEGAEHKVCHPDLVPVADERSRLRVDAGRKIRPESGSDPGVGLQGRRDRAAFGARDHRGVHAREPRDGGTADAGIVAQPCQVLRKGMADRGDVAVCVQLETASAHAPLKHAALR